MQNRIRELRKERNLTQSDLAKFLNVSDRSVGFYETGERDPDTGTLDELATFFGVSIDYLLGRSQVRNIETKSFHSIDLSDLPEEAIKQVEDYIEYIRQKYYPDGTLKKKQALD